jgi:phage terminase large subunit-like protein
MGDRESVVSNEGPNPGDTAREFEQIEERIKRWDPRDLAAAQHKLQDITSREITLWYCNNRNCDGLPHEGFNYKHAQDYQWPPMGSDWDVWFMMCGRGTGKTRTGSNWMRKAALKTPRLALVGRRGPDVRQTMIEGPSGLIKACEAAGEDYDWKPALKEFTFQNGAKAFGYSAEEPATLRGPEHGAAWLDEPSHMDMIEEVWSNLNLGLRVPGMPGAAKILLTSTPLPNPWTTEISTQEHTILVRVPTSRNAHNLDESYHRRVIAPMIGTREGRQELDAELLEDVEGALWKGEWIRRAEGVVWEEMQRIIIAVDPAGTTNRKSDLTGIVAVGRIGERGYVMADESGQLSPKSWASAAMRLYENLKADAIVVETNFGGDMVRQNLENAGFTGRIIESRAVRGKQTRAEPVVNLYEQSKISHLGVFPKLEDEMLTWVPGTGPSPNRVDAMVWGFTELFKNPGEMGWVSPRNLGGTKPANAPSKGPGWDLGSRPSNNPITTAAKRIWGR